MTDFDPKLEAFVKDLPKTDLHLHLDGSIRISTLIELAKENGVALPSQTEAGLRELVFKERYVDLPDYLQGFGYTVACMQNVENLSRVAYELAQDNQREGVRYIEVRFAPQFHVNPPITTVDVIRAVDEGLSRATREFNSREQVVSGREPPFDYGIICCAMRMFTQGFSIYFDRMLEAHRYSPPKRVFKYASMELAQAAVRARDDHGAQVVGFDLAGEEAGYPAVAHREAYAYAHRNFLRKTVHAGEAYGPESIFQAITELHAERIGHGTYLLKPDAIRDPSILNPEAYVEKLGEYIADQRITLEVCLTSNLQTNPAMQSIGEHSLRDFLSKRLSVSLCTDNRTVSNTTVTREILLALKHFKITRETLKSIVMYGFKRSFFHGSYLGKRAYVHQMIDYYEAIEAKHGMNDAMLTV